MLEFACLPSLQTFSEHKKLGNGHPTFIRRHDVSRSGIQGRDSLVEGYLQTWNGRALVHKPVDLVIETDASRKGWRGGGGGDHSVKGISTGGPWCLEEKRLHINCLKLIAVSFGIKIFTKGRVCAHGKLLMDNTAAVAYINKMGSPQSQVLSNLALDLWKWCIHHQMEVSAQHLPGHLNTRADRESTRLLDSSDWKLKSRNVSSTSREMGPLRNRSIIPACLTNSQLL